MAGDGSVRRGPGRPRDTAKDAAVLDATLTLLASEGVARMSVDQVAALAGTAKATIYSRWRTKTELIGAALARLRISWTPEPTGEVRTDLIALLTTMYSGYNELGGVPILWAAMSESMSSGELMRTVREATLLPRRAAIVAVLDNGVASGQLRPGFNAEQIVSILTGMVYTDFLAGRSTEDDWAESVVDIVLRGIAAD